MLLSRVSRTSAYEAVAEEHCGVPNGTEDSPSTKHPDSPEVFEDLTQTSTIPDCVAEDHEISIATVAEEPTTKDSQPADMEKKQNISNATGHPRDHPVQTH